MLKALTVLLLFQLAGEVVAQWLHLPVPGPVIGMALLWLGLRLNGGIPEWLKLTAQQFLRILPLLFVPAGVGVMQHFGRIGDEWFALLTALVGSTALGLLVTAWVLDRLSRGESSP